MLDRFRQLVADYYNERVEKTDGKSITAEDVYVVWSCKTLQNWKALLGTDVPDDMYYELTHDGDVVVREVAGHGAEVGERCGVGVIRCGERWALPATTGRAWHGRSRKTRSETCGHESNRMVNPYVAGSVPARHSWNQALLRPREPLLAVQLATLTSPWGSHGPRRTDYPPQSEL